MQTSNDKWGAAGGQHHAAVTHCSEAGDNDDGGDNGGDNGDYDVGNVGVGDDGDAMKWMRHMTLAMQRRQGRQR